MAKISVADLLSRKKAAVPIVVLTSYDYPSAILEDRAGVDVQLVGDSVGTNVLGRESVAQVTVEDMLHHLRAVSLGAGSSFVLCDMPFHSYQTPDMALTNARQFVAAGANGVKIEGEEAVVDVVRGVVSAGVDVCAHIGHTPQTQARASVQGKDFDRAMQLLDVAKKLESAGAFMLVLELVPEELAREITAAVAIPTIGIGAGRFCDGQVQVIHDIIGYSARQYRHAKQYVNAASVVSEAIAAYGREVRGREFPTRDHAAHLSDEVTSHLRERLGVTDGST